ncbi:hypothetical protein XELAEV_18038865mg [Xenopus laevis]|uniref:PA domain-containing protein n=1 Tax=Xenopus laevis TaxID=8355 RepID=A0A974C6J6_XENLA|nr:hypothetical protein XELAEV_18038865mg [Xenopus laevis]
MELTPTRFMLLVLVSVTFLELKREAAQEDYTGHVRSTNTYEANAYLNLSYFSIQLNSTISKYCECGLYGLNSPLKSAEGAVGIPLSPNLQACDLNTQFAVTSTPWIALIERGNCTFSDKIIQAARHGASAVVIYNAPSIYGNQTIPMVHYVCLLQVLAAPRDSSLT